MRRLPVYFLVDVSESMVGEPIQQVQDGMRTIIQELRTDPYALETVYVSIIAFAGKAKQISPLTELFKFYPPTFPIGSGTSIGVGLNFLMDSIDREVVKTTLESKGDWKPIIFLFTDGTPTDDYTMAFDRWNKHYRKHCNIIPISIGDNADLSILKQISDNVLQLKDTDENAFKAFFKWVTASIRTTSMSVTDTGVDEVKLAPIDGIHLEEVLLDPMASTIDENFAIVSARCQETKKLYLIKYAKRGRVSKELEPYRDLPEIKDEFKLVGAYPVVEKDYDDLSGSLITHRIISTDSLYGRPTCPCCGNQYGMVICECGSIFCVGDSGKTKCPWCGMEGELTLGDGSTNIIRERG